MKLFGNNSKASGGGLKFNIYWLYALIFMVLIGIYYTGESTSVKEMPWTDFEGWVQKKAVSHIVVHANQGDAEAEITDAYAKQVMGKDYQPVPGAKAVITTTIPSADKFEDRVDEWRKSGVFNGKVEYDRHSTFSNIFWSFGPLLLLVVFWIFMMRRMGGGGGGGIFNVGKSRAKLHNKDKDKDVTFADVAGMEREKKEVSEVVEFLKNPKRYTDLGGTIPKGVLLVGPPGTGKTMLAKAVAGEANVPFFSRSGSQFVEKFVGVGASRVRELFAEAKEKAPCVVFIDEIDAVGTKRSNEGFNSEHDQTLNQLLTEMDGIDGASGVIVLAATNREDILDDALLRPGRFDRKVHVTLPALTDREAIFKVHLKKVKVDETVDLTQLARQTPGMSGAEIANVCNEAAILAARQNREAVTMADFNEAIDKVTLGLENKSMLMTRQDVYETAVHEAGHTTTIWLLEHAAPLVKISIVPRGKALGVNMTMPEERVGYTKQAFLDEICSFMGGRAAEELFLGTIGTGALNDMQQATRIARSMVMYYGMSEKMPNISYYDPQGQLGQRPYSDERARLIDEETSRIVNEQYERAKKLISEHAEQHHKVVDALMEKEVIFAADVEAIFGKRPWKSRTEQLMEVAEARRKSQH